MQKNEIDALSTHRPTERQSDQLVDQTNRSAGRNSGVQSIETKKIKSKKLENKWEEIVAGKEIGEAEECSKQKRTKWR